MIEIDNPSARWREIGRAMEDDASWRSGVQGLALTLHPGAERLTPQSLLTYTSDLDR